MPPRVALVNPPREKGLFTPEQRALCRNRAVQIDVEANYLIEFGYMISTRKAQGCEVAVWDGHNWMLSREEIVEELKAFISEEEKMLNDMVGKIQEVSKIFTVELSLYGGLIGYKLGEILKRPSISLHFMKRLLFFVGYKIRQRVGELQR